jgi:N-methylhydantoinase A
MMQIGLGIGDTFMDFAFAQEGHPLVFHKGPRFNRPNDSARTVLARIDELLAKVNVDLRSISEVLHTTTVATNTILKRKNVVTTLIAIASFCDIPSPS